METDIINYYKSITVELEALKNRVRNFIGDVHWLTDGEWKEGVLQAIIARHLPASVSIGRGFVRTVGGVTTQCDLLLYRTDRPVLFRDGDLVILTPDALLGVVEVKTSLDKNEFTKAVAKLSAIGNLLATHSGHFFLGLFSYESDASPRALVS